MITCFDPIGSADVQLELAWAVAEPVGNHNSNVMHLAQFAHQMVLHLDISLITVTSGDRARWWQTVGPPVVH